MLDSVEADRPVDNGRMFSFCASSSVKSVTGVAGTSNMCRAAGPGVPSRLILGVAVDVVAVCREARRVFSNRNVQLGSITREHSTLFTNCRAERGAETRSDDISKKVNLLWRRRQFTALAASLDVHGRMVCGLVSDIHVAVCPCLTRMSTTKQHSPSSLDRTQRMDYHSG
jgi:hypothetical protein